METVALLIPIVFLIGLFTTISCNIYFRYKTNTVMSQRVPIEALGEWYRSNTHARQLRSRGSALRWGGFMVGAGLGTGIGCLVINANGFIDTNYFDRYAIATFLIISIAIVLGGAGMIGAYFLERKLDGKEQKM